MAKGLAKLFKFGFGALDDLGMFSPTEKAIDMLPQQKGTPQQMFKQLTQIGNKPVKEEMLFTGMEDAFASAPKVTSQELKDYLAGNKTRIKETIKSKKAVEKNQTVMNEFDFDRLDNPDRPIDPNTKRSDYDLTNFLAFYSQGDPNSKKILSNIELDETRLGTIKQPFINRIEFDDLSNEFKYNLKSNYEFEAGKFKQFQNREPDKTATDKLDFDTKDLIKFEFSPRGGFNQKDNDYIYRIQGNNTIGYEVLRKLPTEPVSAPFRNLESMSNRANSFNEAKVILNSYRRKVNDMDDDKLRPLHESQTLPGGKNYQELLLSLEEPIDNIASIAGKYDDVIDTTDQYLVIRMQGITGSPSEAALDKNLIKPLKKGEPIQIDDKTTIRYNEDTDNIEVLKRDYVNFSHTGDEKNVVVFARTKDRVDEEGRKILYTEEMQSDMSQQGRKRGLMMGQKEKKAFINKNNPIIFGDILDSIEKLKEFTNIEDLKAIRNSQTELKDSQIGQIRGSKQTIGFENDDNVLAQTNLITGRVFKGVPFDKAHSFEDLVKKHQTKYKFLEMKDNNTKRLTNQGIDKSNVNELDLKTLEQEGIKIPDTLYNDATDYVDMALFQKRINGFRKVLAKKMYDKEYNKEFANILKNIPEDESNRNYIYGQQLKEFNEKMFDKLLPKEDINKFMKKELDESRKSMLSFHTDMNIKDYNKLSDDDIVPGATVVDGQTFRNLKKSDFEKKFVAPDIQNKKSETVRQLISPRDAEINNTKNFDYSENAIEQVFAGLTDLNNKLEKAVAYDVKLRPVSDLPSAPFIGTSERFTELGIKRLLKYARDNDYDGVSFSSGIIHDKRWSEPNLTQYYDVVIPKVANNILKGTDAKLEYKTIFTDDDFLKKFKNDELDYEENVPEDFDFIDSLNEDMSIDMLEGGYIKDTPTIYLTPDIKEYIDSGISLYSPIVATGLAGAITSQILGPEEDIIKDEVANVSKS